MFVFVYIFRILLLLSLHSIVSDMFILFLFFCSFLSIVSHCVTEYSIFPLFFLGFLVSSLSFCYLQIRAISHHTLTRWIVDDSHFFPLNSLLQLVGNWVDFVVASIMIALTVFFLSHSVVIPQCSGKFLYLHEKLAREKKKIITENQSVHLHKRCVAIKNAGCDSTIELHIIACWIVDWHNGRKHFDLFRVPTRKDCSILSKATTKQKMKNMQFETSL